MKYYIVYSITKTPAIKILPTQQLAEDSLLEFVRQYSTVAWAMFEAPFKIHYQCRMALDPYCINTATLTVKNALETIREFIKEERMKRKG